MAIRPNKGSALISALFITALAAIMATAIIVAQRLLIHQSSWVMATDQIYLNLQSMQQSEMASVKQYVNGGTLQTTLPSVMIGDTTLSGYVESAQNKFNLNELVYPQNQVRFVALLRAVVPTLSAETASNIAESITAWMTSGAQNAYYFTLNPPYRSSQMQMADASELRLVAGVTPDIYNALVPFVTALPITPPPPIPQNSKILPPAVQTPVDVNGVSWPVLLTVSSTLTQSQAQSIAACVAQSGNFTDLNTFTTNCVAPAGVSGLAGLTTQSQYFLGVAIAQTGARVSRLTSLLVTQPQKDNKLGIVIISQSFE